jgi:hypothetical protein
MNDQSNKHNTESNDKNKNLGRHIMEDASREDGGRENASATRGGTTDMDTESLTVGRKNESERGSGLHTKSNVSGSDFDGQAS